MRSSGSNSTLVDIGNWPSQPPKWSYRIGNTTIEFQKQPLIFVMIVFALILILYFKYSGGLNSQKYHYEHDFIHIEKNDGYNHTYPLTKPIITPRGLKYRISIIADPDTDSKVIKQLITSMSIIFQNNVLQVEGKPNLWKSYLKRGYLIWDDTNDKVSIEWDDNEDELTSSFSTGGRGMELSDLVVFNGNLYTCEYYLIF